MLISRFWMVVLSLTIGAATGLLFLAAQMYNHAGASAMKEALAADSSSVDWYLRDDSRKRASALIPIALSPDVVAGLGKASGDAKIDEPTRSKVKSALTKLAGDMPAELKADYLWAVDANGRVVERVVVNIDYNPLDELGGFASVADALHGWIRDDAWVWKGRILRVVMRPVEREAQGEPVGAIVGAKLVDDTFARAVSKRTGAAVGFYADGARVSSGAPEGFDKAFLDEITSDLKALDADKDYQEKGRSDARVLHEHLGIVYARLPGEAWDLGAGYAVGHLAVSVKTPLDFLDKADNTDTAKVPKLILGALVLLLIAAGIGFTVMEYNRPLAMFRNEAIRMAKGEVDVLAPSRFRGAYKKIASDLNDGIEKVAAKGGAPRRAADLEQVLGPIPAQPAMSAFAVPGGPGSPGSAVESTTSTGSRALPRPRSSGQVAAITSPGTEDITGDIRVSAPTPAPAPRPPPAAKRPGSAPEPAPAEPAAPAADAGGDFDELEDWRRVYEEFVGLKKQCGEETSSLTFEKFKGTLQRNKDALVSRHNCSRVKFTVYVKEGKAALKASPVK